MFKKCLFLLILAFVVPSLVFAQATIEGTVTAKSTGEPLIGANVVVLGTTLGASTNSQGQYKIVNVEVGQTVDLRVTYIGFVQQDATVDVQANEVYTQDFMLTEDVLSGGEIAVLADRARPRETPVAFSDVKKEEMELRLGSRDIPLVLNTTPSVYATDNGGGAGDARVNVRGFNQRNVAIMINGVPVNDMENGWVYWSNWDGVGDATSSIQVQRGLSAVNLATPSIGGTMNILTDPTAHKSGATFKQEVGNDAFMKSTLSAHTGLINDRYALSGTIVRKTGDGLVDATWTDAWAYYVGAALIINDKNRLEMYALGAPQRHGQNLYKQNIGAYSHEFARDLDTYDPAALEDFAEAGPGLRYNQTWNTVDPDYDGKQYWNGSEHDRYDENFINERENYYHKPLVNLNWYFTPTKKFGLYSTLYYSGGKGGGSGTLGSLVWDYSGPSRQANWNATIARNDTSSTGSLGILRNSVNEQWTIGAISKAKYRLNDNVRTTFGLDWRTAEIKHFREVRDLLGGDYWYSDASDFWSESEMRRGLGDKVAYNFTNTVDWLGFFGQAEYVGGPISTYGMAGWSTIKYTYTNHFLMDENGNETEAESDNIAGIQVKGGASYKVFDSLDMTAGLNTVDVYANVGYVSKVPIFDNVINDRDGTKAEDPENEKFTAFEGGVNLSALQGKMSARISAYYTKWEDRANSIGVTNPDGSEGLVFITGMKQLHTGFEVEAAYQPIDLLRFDLMASIGSWEYTDDVSGVYKDYEGDDEDQEYNYYVDGLKVGDAPQTQIAFTTSVLPTNNSQIQMVYRYYANNYGDWDPFTRTDPEDVGQAWEAPAYGVVDLHASFDFPLNLTRGMGLRFFTHVFNVFDNRFVQDAVDNSPYNGFDGDHDADDAEVYMGLPTHFNVGLTLTY